MSDTFRAFLFGVLILIAAVVPLVVSLWDQWGVN
jgi:hypothetical protein